MPVYYNVSHAGEHAEADLHVSPPHVYDTIISSIPHHNPLLTYVSKEKIRGAMFHTVYSMYVYRYMVSTVHVPSEN